MPASAECKEPGRLVPVVDTSRCEAKADCVEVCPYHVFTVRKLTDAERGALGLMTRFKVFVHGGKQAVRPAVQFDGARATHVTTAPLLAADDQFVGLLALFTDLTPVRHLEGRIRDLQILADLGEISAGIAHEFRNSLATMLGYLQLARREGLPPKAQTQLDKTEKEASLLSAAVDGLASAEQVTCIGRWNRAFFLAWHGDLLQYMASGMPRVLRSA